jgi:hypothetical protein
MRFGGARGQSEWQDDGGFYVSHGEGRFPILYRQRQRNCRLGISTRTRREWKLSRRGQRHNLARCTRSTRSGCVTSPQRHIDRSSGCARVNWPPRRATYRTAPIGCLRQAFTRALWGYLWGYQSGLRRLIPI